MTSKVVKKSTAKPVPGTPAAPSVTAVATQAAEPELNPSTLSVSYAVGKRKRASGFSVENMQAAKRVMRGGEGVTITGAIVLDQSYVAGETVIHTTLKTETRVHNVPPPKTEKQRLLVQLPDLSAKTVSISSKNEAINILADGSIKMKRKLEREMTAEELATEARFPGQKYKKIDSQDREVTLQSGQVIEVQVRELDGTFTGNFVTLQNFTCKFRKIKNKDAASSASKEGAATNTELVPVSDLSKPEEKPTTEGLFFNVGSVGALNNNMGAQSTIYAHLRASSRRVVYGNTFFRVDPDPSCTTNNKFVLINKVVDKFHAALSDDNPPPGLYITDAKFDKEFLDKTMNDYPIGGEVLKNVPGPVFNGRVVMSQYTRGKKEGETECNDVIVDYKYAPHVLFNATGIPRAECEVFADFAVSHLVHMNFMGVGRVDLPSSINNSSSQPEGIMSTYVVNGAVLVFDWITYLTKHGLEVTRESMVHLIRYLSSNNTCIKIQSDKTDKIAEKYANELERKEVDEMYEFKYDAFNTSANDIMNLIYIHPEKRKAVLSERNAGQFRFFVLLSSKGMHRLEKHSKGLYQQLQKKGQLTVPDMESSILDFKNVFPRYVDEQIQPSFNAYLFAMRTKAVQPYVDALNMSMEEDKPRASTATPSKPVAAQAAQAAQSDQDEMELREQLGMND